MALTKLQFKPGINRESTNYSNEGGWWDCDRVRFRGEYPETIGGWTKFSSLPFLGSCRALAGWRALDGSLFIGLGTHLKYYINRGGQFYDVTPVRSTTAAGDVTFSATTGSTELTVTDTGHGAYAGDFVTFSGAVSLGGDLTADLLNSEYQIASVIDADTYTVTAATPATSSDTGNGGAAVVGEYQISVGLDTSVVGDGWGAGGWGSGPWGGPADISIAGAQLRLWSHAPYGEDLVFGPRGEKIYYWDRSGGLTSRGVEMASLPGSSQAPTVANIIVLSERDRHLLVFGTDTPTDPGVLDPLLIRFSSAETLLDWEDLPTNTAGSLRIGSGSAIIAAVQARQMILVITDAGVHSLQFIGPPYTFGLSELANSTTIAGPNAAIAVGDEVFWMGKSEFYRFNGLVQQIPCSVKSYVFEDLNTDQLYKVFSGHNAAFGEVWWFYPSADSETNDRYVVFNYLQQVWCYGTIGRTAWLDRGVADSPIAAGVDGYLYYHEVGTSDGETNPPSSLDPYIQSSPVDLGEGDQFMFISRVIPDVTFARSSPSANPAVDLTITVSNFPGAAVSQTGSQETMRSASSPVELFTTQVFFRLRGRSAAFKFSSTSVGAAWRVGSPRVDVRTDGRRA